MSEEHQRKFARLARQQRMKDILFRAERDQVLRELSEEKLLALMVKWKQPIPQVWGRPDAKLAIMHRARLTLPNFTLEERTISAQWLAAHSYPLPPAMVVRGGVLYSGGVPYGNAKSKH